MFIIIFFKIIQKVFIGQIGGATAKDAVKNVWNKVVADVAGAHINVCGRVVRRREKKLGLKKYKIYSLTLGSFAHTYLFLNKMF